MGRIFYVGGPGDLIGTYRCFLRDELDSTQISLTYSGQFFDVCREQGLLAKVVSVGASSGSIAADGIEVQSWTAGWMKLRGLGYWAGSLIYHLRLLAAILAFRARILVHADFVHWFLLAPVALFGVKVIPTIHCRLWRGDRPVRGLHALILRLNGWYFRRCTIGVMCVSDEIARQVRELAGAETRTLTFSPSYVRGTFSNAPAPPAPRRRILFAGRVEASKGVFDLVESAVKLRSLGREDVAFDICGDGGALPEMKIRARERGVEDMFEFHGHVDRVELPGLIRSCHALIAPTRSEFAEGFNKSVAEGVLAHRPVITSPICPAAAYFGSAVVSVPPDEVDGYVRAIVRLLDDPDYYAAVVREGEGRRKAFYDPTISWAGRLRLFLTAAQEMVPATVSPRSVHPLRAD